MLATWSPTQIAFLIIAVIQAVCGVIWALGALMLGTARGAVAHWVGWTLLSSLTFFIVAARLQSPPLVGILAGVIGVMCLQRGIRLFIGREPTYRLQIVLLVGVVVAYFATDAATRHWQTVVNFGVLGWLYLSIAHDLHGHARSHLRFRWPLLLALPLLLGCVAYGSRAIRALVSPESVLTEMTTNSTLNLASALAFVVLVLALHAMLMALVVTRLTSELRRMSRHDSLTGLLNRRAMEELLYTQVQRCDRAGTFAVMMLDLDHFKRVNDHFGHAVGDLALKHVAKLLRGAVREVDSLARFGGEEFIVLMPGTVLTQAQPIAERLRERLSVTPLSHGSLQVPLSISIGIAQWRGSGDDLSQVLVRADTALFQAKGQGRNRVVLDLSEADAAAALT
jgi:diguanylate cyclase (GGDEF)-like protein